MKSSLTHLKNHLVCFGAVLFLFTSACAAKAQILLQIDDSNPYDVIITTTGTAPGQNASGSFADGVDLLGFFTSTTYGVNFTVNSTDLTTGDGSSGTGTYTQAFGDNISVSNVDLNLFNLSSTATATFSFSPTPLPAFSGSISLNLDGYALPTNGSTGTLVLGFSGDSSNPQLGYYQVVNPSISAPEPSSWALLFAGLILFGIWSRRVAARKVHAGRVKS